MNNNAFDYKQQLNRLSFTPWEALLQKGSLSPPQFCYLFSSRSCGNMGR